MAEDHEAPKAGQLPTAWIRGRRETESPKSEQRRVRSWTMQNEMRGVLGQVSTSAARRILDSSNPRESIVNVTTEYKFLSEDRGSLWVKKFK